MQTTKIKTESKSKVEDKKTSLNGSGDTNYKINFNNDVITIFEELRQMFNPKYDISLQLLSAKEIEKHLNKLFKNFVFNVFEVDSETSKRLIMKFADPKYWNGPKNESELAILNDILSCGILTCKDDKVIEANKKTKITLEAKIKNQIFSKGDEYIFNGKLRAVKISIKSKDKKNLINRNIFTIPGINIDDKLSRNKLYKRMAIGAKIKSLPEYKSIDCSKDGFYKTLDLNLILSICKLIDESFDYLDSDTSFLYKASNTYYNKIYNVEDMYNLLNVSFLGEKESVIPKEIAMLIIECIITATHVQVSTTLNNNYYEEMKRFYNEFNALKENKSPKYRAIEKNNRFLEHFNSVKVDNGIDIEKFFKIENEFIRLEESLGIKNFLNKKANLVFKKINQKNLNFIYNADKNDIYVNIDDPTTFCMGIAHYLDYTLGNKKPLSMEPEFKILAFEYKNLLENDLHSNTIDAHSIQIYKQKRHIYHTPTEIWSRCFELYLSIANNIEGGLLHSKEYMTICNGYPKINDKLINTIINYFSNIIEVIPKINTSTIEVSGLRVDTTGINNEERICSEEIIAVEEAAATSVEVSHDGDGSNYFFRLIEVALSSSNQTTQIKKRRRRKVSNIDINATQVKFF